MFTNVDNLLEFYNRIRTKKICILVNPEIDSLCSLKILVSLLKSDSCQYEIIPLSGYGDLGSVSINSQAVICLNVGGLVDITTFVTENVPIYILDSHRPLNLYNCFSSKNSHVVVFLDALDDMDEILKMKAAFEELEFDSDSDESEEDEAEKTDEEKENDENDSDDNESQLGDKRKKDSLDTEVLKKARKNAKLQRKKYKRDIAEYYSEGSSYGKPVCGSIYQLADSLSRVNNNMLWFTIVSMTGHFLLDRMDNVEYEGQVLEWKTEVERLTINNQTTSNGRDQLLQNLELTASKNKKTADDNTISFQEDAKIVLLRHWNFRDSMFNTPYVVSKLGLWKEAGRTRLVNLLVKMGLPKKQASQRFQDMDLNFKKTLKEKLFDIAPRYNMENIRLLSFEKNYGYKCTLSATDVVYSISALLDCGVSWIEKHGASHYEGVVGVTSSVEEMQASEDPNSGDAGLIGAGIGTKTMSGEIATQILDIIGTINDQDQRHEWVKHFYAAYDALENPTFLQHGILLAIHFQRLLVNRGILIMENKDVKTLKKFQLVILSSNSFDEVTGESESQIFGKSVPLLHRLSGFLMEAFREHKQRRLPFVIAALDDSSKEFLVMGRAALSSSIIKNPFGLAFIQAAQETGVETRHDYFDNYVISVPEDDLPAFLDNLQMNL